MPHELLWRGQNDELKKVYSLLDAVLSVYEKAGQPFYFGDNMAALCRNMAFSKDRRFVFALRDNARTKADGF